MATRIRASCTTCGDVDLRVQDVCVQAAPPGGNGCYAFVCPACGDHIVKDAECRVIDLLVASGVPVVPEIWASSRSGLPPLTELDADRFREVLRDDAQLEAFLDHARGRNPDPSS